MTEQEQKKPVRRITDEAAREIWWRLERWSYAPSAIEGWREAIEQLSKLTGQSEGEPFGLFFGHPIGQSQQESQDNESVKTRQGHDLIGKCGEFAAPNVLGGFQRCCAEFPDFVLYSLRIKTGKKGQLKSARVHGGNDEFDCLFSFKSGKVDLRFRHK